MIKLEIHESLIEYIRELTQKPQLDYMDLGNQEIAKQVNSLYEDCKYLTSSLNFFKFAVYNIVGQYYPLAKVDIEVTKRIMGKLLENKEFRKKLFSYQPKSEFFSVVKDLLEPYLRLKNFIESRKRYDAIITYRDILDLLDTETMGKRKGKALEEECQKRYVYPYDTVKQYNRRMKEKKYKKIDKLDVRKSHHKPYLSATCKIFYDYFHDMMIDFYNKTGYIYAPFNEDIDFYQFGKIGIISYKYDSDLSMSIKGFDPKHFEFWALLFSGNKISINTFQLKKIIDFDGELLFAPKGYVEEAFIKYLMNSLGEREYSREFISLLESIGIDADYCYSHGLTTYDGKIYFKDPKNTDNYTVRDIDQYPTLKALKEKDDEEREKYIKKIIATYKGKYKEREEEISSKERRKGNPKAWLD